MDVSEEIEQNLHWPDWAILGTVLSISASIGVYYRFYGGGLKTAEEYFSANGALSVPLLSITIMVSLISAISVLSVSGETYIHGSQFFLICIGLVIGAKIVTVVYLPVFYNFQYLSVYEYLQGRFGLTARLVASIANYFQLLFYGGIVLFAPALVLEATTGLSSTLSILLIGLICTFYSSIGGLKAVLATDVFQGCLMFAAVFSVIGIACSDNENGVSGVWEINEKGGRANFFDFTPDLTVRHGVWALTIGGSFYYMTQVAVGQIHVQRLLSASTLRAAQHAALFSVLITAGMTATILLSGLFLYSWFIDCDPVASGRVASFDQIMAYFSKIRMSKIPGAAGVFIAGIFSASLSTLSALLNSLGAIAIADYVRPLYRKSGREMKNSTALLLARLISVLNGFIVVGLAFLASQLDNMLQAAIGIISAIGGPVLGLFSLGMFMETANELGSVIGTFLSLSLTIWMTFGRPRPHVLRLPVSVDNCPNSTHKAVMAYQRKMALWESDDTEYLYIYRMSYMWVSVVGVCAALLFGYIASFVVRYFSKNPPTELDPNFFTPILAARIRRRRGNTVKNTTSQVFVLDTTH